MMRISSKMSSWSSRRKSTSRRRNKSHSLPSSSNSRTIAWILTLSSSDRAQLFIYMKKQRWDESIFERDQEIVLNDSARMNPRSILYLQFNAFSFKVHQIPTEFKVRKHSCELVMSHLHMLRMQFYLILSIYFRIELLESSTITVIQKDDFPKVMQRESNRHVIQQSFTPVLIFILCESKARSSQDEVIIVHLKTKRIKEADSVVYKPEVHTSYGETFPLVNLAFIYMASLTTHRRSLQFCQRRQVFQMI